MVSRLWWRCLIEEIWGHEMCGGEGPAVRLRCLHRAAAGRPDGKGAELVAAPIMSARKDKLF